MSHFPCTQCGLCCKQLKSSLDNLNSFPLVIQDLLKRFPHQTKPDGSCSMLNDDGSCSVYENRPIICNIDLMGQLLHIDTPELYRINAESCNTLINNANLNPKYLVQISEAI